MLYFNLSKFYILISLFGEIFGLLSFILIIFLEIDRIFKYEYQIWNLRQKFTNIVENYILFISRLSRNSLPGSSPGKLGEILPPGSSPGSINFLTNLFKICLNF